MRNRSTRPPTAPSAAHADASLTLTGAAITRSKWIKHPVSPRVGLTGDTWTAAAR